jgi:UDP-glucose 4-epimerase/UDP-glucuronate decarboxylase
MGTKHVIPQFILRSKNREEPYNIYGDTQTRAFCYVDDAVRASYDVAISGNNGIYHIGNDLEEIQIIKLAKKINLWYNHNVDYSIKDSPPGSVRRRCPDITKIKREISFQPKVGLEKGLQKTIEWYDQWYENRQVKEGLL